MNLKPKTLMLIALAVLVMFFGTFFLTTCKSPASADDDDIATVVGCGQVRYGGITYNITGCGQSGVVSFDVTITQSGHTASFHITCSGGCISTAVPF